MVLVMIAGNVEKFGERRGLETPVAEYSSNLDGWLSCQ